MPVFLFPPSRYNIRYPMTSLETVSFKRMSSLDATFEPLTRGKNFFSLIFLTYIPRNVILVIPMLPRLNVPTFFCFCFFLYLPSLRKKKNENKGRRRTCTVLLAYVTSDVYRCCHRNRGSLKIKNQPSGLNRRWNNRTRDAGCERKNRTQLLWLIRASIGEAVQGWGQER